MISLKSSQKIKYIKEKKFEKILKELHHPFNLYKFNGIIGDGGFGCVIHVENIKTFDLWSSCPK